MNPRLHLVENTRSPRGPRLSPSPIGKNRVKQEISPAPLAEFMELENRVGVLNSHGRLQFNWASIEMSWRLRGPARGMVGKGCDSRVPIFHFAIQSVISWFNWGMNDESSFG